jgi:5-methyltetrahydrofolate--homocysteine methyltransferase
MFLPEVMLAARAMQEGLDVLIPRLGGDTLATRGTVVVGTVRGDIHDIGKSLVGTMLRGAGYRVVDLGVDVRPAAFVDAVRTHDAAVVAMSALLTTTMPVMGEVVTALRAAGLDHVKTLVGGAPLTERFAREIGVDAYGADPPSGVTIVRGWLDSAQR